MTSRSGSTVDVAAALIVHRQASFQKQHVQPRSNSFSTTVARLIESTKRRQAKSRDKAREQELRVGQLQQAFDESVRLKALKEERDVLRMERKLQHAAATYIQYVWRKRRYLHRLRLKRVRASCVIATFVSARMLRHKRLRQEASARIQKQWRAHTEHQKYTRCLRVLGTFLSSLTRARRASKTKHAIRIQRWFRGITWKKKRSAACVLQRAWRLHLSKKSIARCSKAYRHLKHMQTLEQSAKVLQRALGKRAVYCRLVQSNELARYPQVVAASSRPSEAKIAPTDLQSEKHKLKEANALHKRLTAQEVSLVHDLEVLERRLRDSKERRDEEAEKLQRFDALEACRRSKDDATVQEKLRELETRMRNEIRLELEKDVEASRRALLREKSLQQQTSGVPALDCINARQSCDDDRPRSKSAGWHSRRKSSIEAQEERLE